MMRSLRFGLVAMLAFAVVAGIAFAHGDLHEQIAKLTAQIEKTPGSAELYLKRAELHRLHEDWAAAEADYARAEQLAPNAGAIHLGRGKMLLAAGRFDDARAELDKFLAGQPDDIDGLVTRARIERKREKPLVAAGDFARAVALAPRSEPEVFLECAQALAAAGDDHLADALRCLDDGTSKLGNLPSLGLYAIELERSRKNFDAALARLDKLSATSPRKEAWLERRGDILTAAGRPAEARQAYLAATEALRILPPQRRATKATNDLEARLKQKTAP
jgi:predicted Zn-dependent protease